MQVRDIYSCPYTGQPLTWLQAEVGSEDGRHRYPIHNGIADFYVEDDASRVPEDDANRKWLSVSAMEGRDMSYRRHREWPGMAFIVQRVAELSRTRASILEVGAGTGHLTRWMAEACGSGTSIHAFDFSWPALERIKARTEGLSSVTLFRGNARGAMPFLPESFDIIVQRLAPFSPKGACQADKDARALALLRPGGWCLFAGWEDEAGWTVQNRLENGFSRAEHHRWAYPYDYTDDEVIGGHMEGGASRAEAEVHLATVRRDAGLATMRREYLFAAQKPG